jgi:hypothetical protein
LLRLLRAASTPTPGRPSASATAATVTTADSAKVNTPSNRSSACQALAAAMMSSIFCEPTTR